MKRILAFVCGLSVVFGLTACSSSKKGVTILDSSGQTIATVTKMDFSTKDLVKADYRTYVAIVLDEAVDALEEKYDCSEKEAKSKLFAQPLTIKTAFNSKVQTATQKMYAKYKSEGLSIGCAINDNKGNLCAAFSVGDKNYATETQSPYSTIKPLSVYAPAIERGMIDWSTLYTDKPYKQIVDESGKTSDWPKNVTNNYTYKDTTVAQAIKESINTVAVHCLATLRVKYSISFLESSFDMNLEYEENKATLQGAKEVLGNVGLGYLYKGVSPVDLAGYYQIFTNGGKYVKPHAISEITDASGKAVYTAKPQTRQIISEQTAYIMNRLLREVVLPGGTGSKALVGNTPTIGKTGTGTDKGGNWFVGSTTQYSCALWHSDNGSGNFAPQLFYEIFSEIPNLSTNEFTPCDTVESIAYCNESGKKATSSCTSIHVGYYAADRIPSDCDMH